MEMKEKSKKKKDRMVDTLRKCDTSKSLGHYSFEKEQVVNKGLEDKYVQSYELPLISVRGRILEFKKVDVRMNEPF